MDDEFALIRLHAQMGYDVLSKHESTKPYAKVALYHHRWYNEQGGYPVNTSYCDEPDALLYQIVTCADCIDAATDFIGRAYSRGKTFEEMLVDLRQNSGRIFNPDLVALFDDAALCERVERLLKDERGKMYDRAFMRAG